MNFLKNYIASLVVMGILDFLWLGIIAKKFNQHQLQHIARLQDGEINPQKIPALMVYLLMAAVATIFLYPKLTNISVPGSFIYGAALGFCVYGIYDLTNAAIIRSYPWPFALVDMGWGTFLFGATAVAYKFWSEFLNSQMN